MRRRLTWLLALAVAPSLVALGCSSASDREPVSGAVGVFYGGEVQRLMLVKLSANDKRSVGFRIVFPAEKDNSTARRVSWKIVRPGPSGRRVAEVGATTVAASRERLDHVVAIPNTARLGTYNIRVLVDARVIVDRALLIQKAD